VGYIYRYAPVFQTAHDLLRQPQETAALGKPVLATLRIGGRGSHQLWKHQTASGGGVMNEMLVHMLDLAYWLFGEIADARLLKKELLRPVRDIRGETHQVDAEDLVLVELAMRSGAKILIQADLLTPGFSQHVEIQGEQGSFMGSIQPDIPTRLFCSHETSDYKAGWNTLSLPAVNLLDAQMAHFVNVIRSSDVTPKVSVRDSMALINVMNILKGSPAYESAA